MSRFVFEIVIKPVIDAHYCSYSKPSSSSGAGQRSNDPLFKRQPDNKPVSVIDPTDYILIPVLWDDTMKNEKPTIDQSERNAKEGWNSWSERFQTDYGDDGAEIGIAFGPGVPDSEDLGLLAISLERG